MDLQSLYSKLQIQDMNQMQKAAFKAAEAGHDLVLLSPTGSGKTLAFLFPVLKKLQSDSKGIQTLILVPARELALQIEQVFKAMGSEHKITVCYGGHDKKTELNSLTQAPSVLIGTPGRVGYHLRNGNFDPSTIKTLVLDEFDKALEFGFKDEMSFIIQSLSNLDQRLLTSATAMSSIPDFVGIKNKRTENFLKNEDVKPEIQFRKIISTSEDKLNTLFNLLCNIGDKRTLIFCNHREAVIRISELLNKKAIYHETFHGAMEQDERERALLKFRNDSVRILITTDLASRGLDIPEVASIVHYQLPLNEDAFIHRNGRTARMNATGFSYLMLTPDEQYEFLKEDIQEDASLTQKAPIPEKPAFETVYFSTGKKNKVNKIDIVGFLIKTGGLEKDDIGLIEVKDTTSYAAVNRKKTQALLKKLANEKLKNQKVKIEVAY